ncbi:hypothetical protein PVAP13_1KG053808 [Panicum virgatum]|uniref:Uncharacterized protein n=1 Tax=Panicum virgatum TaxID=38727 RepID=A0A8T0XFK8_PANVG|nr:hypothetical protein PVAP13_1KG053808 [Panicum virgatum]
MHFHSLPPSLTWLSAVAVHGSVSPRADGVGGSSASFHSTAAARLVTRSGQEEGKRGSGGSPRPDTGPPRPNPGPARQADEAAGAADVCGGRRARRHAVERGRGRRARRMRTSGGRGRQADAEARPGGYTRRWQLAQQ